MLRCGDTETKLRSTQTSAPNFELDKNGSKLSDVNCENLYLGQAGKSWKTVRLTWFKIAASADKQQGGGCKDAIYVWFQDILSLLCYTLTGEIMLVVNNY